MKSPHTRRCSRRSFVRRPPGRWRALATLLVVGLLLGACGTEPVPTPAVSSATILQTTPSGMATATPAATVALAATEATPRSNTAETGTELPDAEVRAILRRRIDEERQGVGIVVGLIDGQGSRVISYGRMSKGDPRPVDGDTVFEIGSISKVFTGALLAGLVAEKQLDLDEPIANLLPPEVTVPSRNGKQITLRHLVTHTSGLPRLPDDFTPSDLRNPYADYTVEALYAFLSGYTLTRDIGAQYEYSNLGMGLLGHILSLHAASDYETLVKTRVAEPLGMVDTTIGLSEDQRRRLAPGHDAAGTPVDNWDIRTLEGAGALRSTTDDLLRFLAANMGLEQTSLTPALQQAHQPLHTIQPPDAEIGMAWHINDGFGQTFVWHNGETGGYHSFIGFSLAQQRGVVVLANSASNVDDIGFHLLDARAELLVAQPVPQRTAVAVDPALYDAYVGDYELAPSFVLTVRRRGDRLYAQATGQSELEIFPASESEFFFTVVDAQLRFVRDGAGAVTGLVLRQGGQEMPGKKLP